jgi:hypothetical protein
MTEVETWRELTCGVIEVTMKRPRAGIDDPHPPPVSRKRGRNPDLLPRGWVTRSAAAGVRVA